MRAITLARAAAQAEKVRLQAAAARQIRRGVYGMGSVVFGLGALSWAHGIAWLALRPVIGSIWASASLLAFDLLVAGICVTLAVLSKPGQVEVEAQRLKELALGHLSEAMTLPALFPAFAVLINRKRRPPPRSSEACRQDLRRLTWPRRFSA
jgi:hypothetical protein